MRARRKLAAQKGACINTTRASLLENRTRGQATKRKPLLIIQRVPRCLVTRHTRLTTMSKAVRVNMNACLVARLQDAVLTASMDKFKFGMLQVGYLDRILSGEAARSD
ncbi:hypothetical protein NDU88_007697 [Pleurodeles waltl]|uniref:Uncharacterized protein n=1 Tax=Pleurodeles waltl TaxID=8319 RepID=A0AAV7U0I1_PLEWA|nr:hypothetical protein NDU88_007697 [Pleurodeles waltl]